MSRTETSGRLAPRGSGPDLIEIATLFARGYMRLVSSQNTEAAQIAPSPEPATGSPNCLDVSVQQSDELVAHQPVGRS